MKRASLPTAEGKFDIHWFDGAHPEMPNLALTLGLANAANAIPLVRIHSECMTGDVFGSMRCDCGEQLSRSMRLIAGHGYGAVIYLRQEGRGIGLVNKLRAYQLQEQGLDTVDANLALGLPAEGRHFDVAIEIIRALGMTRLSLLTNNPEKISSVEAAGLQLESVVPLIVRPRGPEDERYLKTKRERMGHAV